MARKRKDLGLKRPAIGLVAGATILGIGGSVAVGVGGSGAGISAAASFLPAIGATVGAGLTIGQLRKLENQRKHRK